MLKYIHGTMDSSKSASLLIKAYQLERSGRRVLLIKSATDTRDKGEIRSRIGIVRQCDLFTKEADLYILIPRLLEEYAATWTNTGKITIMLDECQFCTVEQIQQLRKLLWDYHMDIYCYGLKTTYLNTPFSSAAYLLALRDEEEEIIAPCIKCGNDASTHLRYVDEVPVFEGDVEVIGDTKGVSRYESVCQDCWGAVYRQLHE